MPRDSASASSSLFSVRHDPYPSPNPADSSNSSRNGTDEVKNNSSELTPSDVGPPPSPPKPIRPRNYPCDKCSKSFMTNAHLTRHSKTHTGEKKFKCPFPGCDTRCTRSDNLQQHYRIHLGTKSRSDRSFKLDMASLRTLSPEAEHKLPQKRRPSPPPVDCPPALELTNIYVFTDIESGPPSPESQAGYERAESSRSPSVSLSYPVSPVSTGTAASGPSSAVSSFPDSLDEIPSVPGTATYQSSSFPRHSSLPPSKMSMGNVAPVNGESPIHPTRPHVDLNYSFRGEANRYRKSSYSSLAGALDYAPPLSAPVTSRMSPPWAKRSVMAESQHPHTETSSVESLPPSSPAVSVDSYHSSTSLTLIQEKVDDIAPHDFKYEVNEYHSPGQGTDVYYNRFSPMAAPIPYNSYQYHHSTPDYSPAIHPYYSAAHHDIDNTPPDILPPGNAIRRQQSMPSMYSSHPSMPVYHRSGYSHPQHNQWAEGYGNFRPGPFLQ